MCNYYLEISAKQTSLPFSSLLVFPSFLVGHWGEVMVQQKHMETNWPFPTLLWLCILCDSWEKPCYSWQVEKRCIESSWQSVCCKGMNIMNVLLAIFQGDQAVEMFSQKHSWKLDNHRQSLLSSSTKAESAEKWISSASRPREPFRRFSKAILFEGNRIPPHNSPNGRPVTKACHQNWFNVLRACHVFKKLNAETLRNNTNSNFDTCTQYNTVYCQTLC